MICRKCNGPGSLFIRKEYCYCNECFITSINHKFRACIGKNKTLSANENVLICVSGDESSTVLLDLIHTGISLNNHKKLRVIPYFLHIIENGDNDENISKLLNQQCENYKFNISAINIDEYYKKCISYNTDDGKTNLCTNISKDSLSYVPTSISKDVIMKIKQNLFVKVAKELKCQIVFTAETTTMLAAKLLSNIAIGRGSQVENDIGFADKREENVKILRPMKDITDEEIEHYINIRKLKPAKREKLFGTSLQSVIKSFVMDLQENYPATVSTICKTADKIGSSSNNINNKKCAVCQSNLDSNNLNLTAMDATMFSRKVSSRHSDVTNDNEILHFEEDRNLMFPLIYESLCYCCSRNVSQLNDPVNKVA